MKKVTLFLISVFGVTLLSRCGKTPDALPIQPAPTENAQLTTFAGSGKVGDLDGPADSARFVFVWGIAFDPAGNLLVADKTNDLIRKVSPDRVVTTVAGNGYSMYRQEPRNGRGRNAVFNSLNDLAVDSTGTCFVVEQSTWIRKVTPDGQVSTFTVLPTNGYGGANAYGYGSGIAFGPTGDLFVSSSTCIYRVNRAGIVSLFSGQPGYPRGFRDGNADSARFVNPEGLAFDRAGNLFVADASKIRKVFPDGHVVTVAGGESGGNQDGVGTDARFNSPHSLAFDQKGDLYIGGINSIRKLTPDGRVSTVTGPNSTGNTKGILAATIFNDIRGLAFDKAGRLYVASSSSRRIQRITFD